MYREFGGSPLFRGRGNWQVERTSFLPGVCVKGACRAAISRRVANLKGVRSVFGEYESASVFQALGVVGIGIYIGTCAMFLRRAIGGDSLAYFAGNAVAAALLLMSNIGNFDLTAMLVQMGLVAAGFGLMIVVFPAEVGNRERG